MPIFALKSSDSSGAFEWGLKWFSSFVAIYGNLRLGSAMQSFLSVWNLKALSSLILHFKIPYARPLPSFSRSETCCLFLLSYLQAVFDLSIVLSRATFTANCQKSAARPIHPNQITSTSPTILTTQSNQTTQTTLAYQFKIIELMESNRKLLSKCYPNL